MWWFASEQPGLPLHTTQLGAPEGMPFYYSSPIHGWLAWPLIPLFGVAGTWNVLVVLARIATPLCAFFAGRAWGLERTGALVAAAVYGCSPFFHGFAVEGIVEGLDGWTLPLFLWAHFRGRRLLAVLAFALVVVSSWYLGAVVCLLALCLGRRAWPSALVGLLLASPLVWAFGMAFPESAAVPAEVRAMMGTSVLPGVPGILADNPFAKTSWIGLTAPVLALVVVRERRLVAGLLAVFWVLSLGLGPDLPGLSSLRFPYRLHAGVLVLLAGLAGLGAQRWSWGAWLAPLIVVEGLLLSPIEPLIPGAPAEMHPIYDELPDGDMLLDIPGPLAMPPGQINPSRPRARWFLYQQVFHGRASPWIPDFNGVGVAADDGLDAVRALDPHGPDSDDDLRIDAELVVVHGLDLELPGFVEVDEVDGKRLLQRIR
ncbi:MAG TPA: hypothetical protein QGF58_05215 [Myxococcota bacterium]|nr:hypothetical protein [Myxococcota bacterium]